MRTQFPLQRADKQLTRSIELLEAALRPNDADRVGYADVDLWHRLIWRAIGADSSESDETPAATHVLLDGERRAGLDPAISAALRQGKLVVEGVRGILVPLTDSDDAADTTSPAGHQWLRMSLAEARSELERLSSSAEYPLRDRGPATATQAPEAEPMTAAPAPEDAAPAPRSATTVSAASDIAPEASPADPDRAVEGRRTWPRAECRICSMPFRSARFQPVPHPARNPHSRGPASTSCGSNSMGTRPPRKWPPRKRTSSTCLASRPVNCRESMSTSEPLSSSSRSGQRRGTTSRRKTSLGEGRLAFGCSVRTHRGRRTERCRWGQLLVQPLASLADRRNDRRGKSVALETLLRGLVEQYTADQLEAADHRSQGQRVHALRGSSARSGASRHGRGGRDRASRKELRGDGPALQGHEGTQPVAQSPGE